MCLPQNPRKPNCGLPPTMVNRRSSDVKDQKKSAENLPMFKALSTEDKKKVAV